MKETTYTGMAGTQQQTGTDNGGGILKFIIGLISGIVVTAPVTTLVVKKVCDKNKEKEVQAAYNRGTDVGMQVMAQVAKTEIAKITAEVPVTTNASKNNTAYGSSNTSQSPSKAPSSASEPSHASSDGPQSVPTHSHDQDIEEEPREASEGDLEASTGPFNSSDPFFNGYSEEELMEEVDRDLLMDGYSEDSLEAMKEAYKISKGMDCFDTSKDAFMGSTYKMMLYSKASELRMNAVKKAAEKAKENIDKAASDEKGASENVSNEADNPVTAVASDDPNIPVVNMVERDYSSGYATGSGVKGINSYFRGRIEDPESRAEFERKMAESTGPLDDEDINNYDLSIDDEEATQEAREFSESRVEYLDMLRTYKNLNGDIPPMTISEEQFENEHIYEKHYINYYDVDDVFEENDAKLDDPYYLFGFVNGKEMFSPDRVVNREDPEICHVRNFKTSSDFEITRVHGSYSQMIEDGEVYYRGETNPQY